jgi:hypothetical protein
MAAREAAFLGANRFQMEINPLKSKVLHEVGAVRRLTAVRGIRVMAVGNVGTGGPKRREERKVSTVAGHYSSVAGRVGMIMIRVGMIMIRVGVTRRRRESIRTRKQAREGDHRRLDHLHLRQTQQAR